MADLGLKEEHCLIINNYLAFSKVRRNQYLNSIDYLFQDVTDTRLLESSYTVDEVSEILSGLRDLLRGEVGSALATAAHMHVLLLQQLCAQAERWHLALTASMDELENSSLLEQVRKLDEGPDGGLKSSKNVEEEESPVALLRREIARLTVEMDTQRQENSKLQEKFEEERTLRTAAESAVQDLEESCKILQTQLSAIKDELEQLREQLTASSAPMDAPATAASPESSQLEGKLQETNLALQQTRARLELAEQELNRKINETSAFMNLRRMLDGKNEQLRELRNRLAALDTEDAPDEPEEGQED